MDFKNERLLEIIDSMFDLLSDEIGKEKTFFELENNYMIKFTDEEKKYLTRGCGCKYE